MTNARIEPEPTVQERESTSQLDSLNDLQRDQPGKVHTWPVIATLIIVLAEAVVLGFAAKISGSAVLFAATAQTLGGAGVELFLLIGVRRAARPPDERHPIGYGREAFFWSLIASVGIFVGGGAISIAQGVRTFGDPESGNAYLLGYIVLAVIVVADAYTLVASLRPLRNSAIVGRVGFRQGLRHTSDAGARTLVFDNASAVLGGLLAIAGLAVHQATGDVRADSIASLLIGVLLLATTVVLLHTNRELLTDRAISPALLEGMRTYIGGRHGVVDVPNLAAIYTGPQAVIVFGTVVFDKELDVHEVEESLAECGRILADRWPGPLRLYLSPVDGDATVES